MSDLSRYLTLKKALVKLSSNAGYYFNHKHVKDIVSDFDFPLADDFINYVIGRCVDRRLLSVDCGVVNSPLNDYISIGLFLDNLLAETNFLINNFSKDNEIKLRVLLGLESTS